MPTYTMQRRGVLMEGDPGEPNEAWGVLNPLGPRPAVAGHVQLGTELQRDVRYCAGIMVHDPEDVSRLTYRSCEPVLEPATLQERDGIVPNVVFPTAIDVRGSGLADVFYGMADSRIGWARLTWTD